MSSQCQWIGEGEGCEHTALPGRSYCEQHIWLVYQQGSAVRRKKDARRAQAVWDLESEMNQAVQELIDEGYDFNEERWEAEVTEA